MKHEGYHCMPTANDLVLHMSPYIVWAHYKVQNMSQPMNTDYFYLPSLHNPSPTQPSKFFPSLLPIHDYWLPLYCPSHSFYSPGYSPLCCSLLPPVLFTTSLLLHYRIPFLSFPPLLHLSLSLRAQRRFMAGDQSGEARRIGKIWWEAERTDEETEALSSGRWHAYTHTLLPYLVIIIVW